MENVIREIKIDGISYGMWLQFDIDSNTYSAKNCYRVWKYQDYKTRNGKKMRRRISVSRNTELHQIVRESLIQKYVETKEEGAA